MKLLLIILFIAIVVAYFLYEKNRGDALEDAARQLLFTLERGQQSLPPELEQAGFYLFAQGAPRIQNRMQGEHRGYQMVLAEFFYDAAFGEAGDRHLPNSDNDGIIERHAQMFVWIRSADKVLPEFDLSPVDSTTRYAARDAGYHALQFDVADRFNSTFNLAGNDDQSIRSLFTDDLRNLLMQQPELVWESRGNQWLFYIPDNRIAATHLDNFIDYIVQILDQPNSQR